MGRNIDGYWGLGVWCSLAVEEWDSGELSNVRIIRSKSCGRWSVLEPCLVKER